jgi:hypothetical protein
VITLVDLEAIYKDIPYNEDKKFSKDDLPELPSCFKPTLWGQPKWGMVAQYRCKNLHAYDFGEYWLIHKDKRNPLTHPVEHLVEDAPHVLGAMVGAGLFATGAAIALFKRSKKKPE